MEIVEIVRYRDEIYPAGFRKIFALMLLFSVTALPELFSWSEYPGEQSPAAGMPAGRFRPQGGFLSHHEEPKSSFLQKLWTFIKRSCVVLITIFAVMLYYPRSGFKRYALLCGPVFAFVVPFCVANYLQGRTEVYRGEIAAVSVLALAPGIALYVFLTWRKAQRLGMEW
jgi:hypothetical protein